MKSDGFKTLIGISLLVVALSVAYHYVIYIPQKEQKQLDLVTQEQQAKYLKEQQDKLDEQAANAKREQNISDCLSNAEENYSKNWFASCKTLGRLTSKCISLNELTYEEYWKQNAPKIDENLSADEKVKIVTDFVADYNKEKEECLCTLPAATATRWDDTLKDSEDACYKRYEN